MAWILRPSNKTFENWIAYACNVQICCNEFCFPSLPSPTENIWTLHTRLCFRQRAASKSYKGTSARSHRRISCLLLTIRTGRTARWDNASFVVLCTRLEPWVKTQCGGTWIIAHVGIVPWIRHVNCAAPTAVHWFCIHVLLQVWIVDDMVRKDEQKWAPPGTCFHHFGVFPLSSASRSDCTYEHIPAMRLPSIAKTINVCEVYIPCSSIKNLVRWLSINRCTFLVVV
jgi:hypothetical protein